MPAVSLQGLHGALRRPHRPTSRAAQMLYGLAMAGGGGKGDVTELARLTEAWAGTEISATRRNEK